jgi:hypothetical protein
MLSNILENQTGKLLISIILGLGLATFFRKVCKDNCIIMRGPDKNELNKFFYKYDSNCFKYTPYEVTCEDNK